MKADWRNRIVLYPDHKAWLGVVIAVSLYTSLRVATIPSNPESTHGFSHDSAYLSIIARNLLAGRGYVNDTHWLVFLNPDSLPLPYHNANPLYPTLMAAMTFVSGVDVTYSGFLIAALSSGLLVLAITLMVNPYTGHIGRAVLLGFCGAIFPPVLKDSFHLLGDALFVALFFAFVAGVVRLHTRWGRLAAGALLGLTWLARSQVIFALPAVLLYTILRCGWRRGASRFAQIGLMAAVVASPWLIHTQMVWGNPFRSDGSYYLMQDYHVMRDSQRYRDSVHRYWHSPNLPPGFASVIKNDPWGFTSHVLQGIPKVVKLTLAHWSMANIKATSFPLPQEAAIVGVLFATAVLAFWLDWRWSLSPGGLAVGLYALCMLLVFAIRSESFEMRFFNTLSVFFAVFAGAGCLKARDYARRRHRSTAVSYSIGLCTTFLWLWIVPAKAVEVRYRVNRTNDDLLRYQLIAAEVDHHFARGKAVVAGTFPYYYTFATSSPALSMPEGSDQLLLAYMDKYGAEYLLLTQREIAFWRPAWGSSLSIPKQLELVDHIGTAALFRRRRTQ